MTDLTTLQSLRDRVAKAAGPMLGGPASDISDALHPVKDKSQREAFRALQEALGDGSIDAALAWVELVLPGWNLYLAVFANGTRKAELVPTTLLPSHMDLPAHIKATACTPALAIILAGLDALIAQAKEKTDDQA